MSPNRLGACCNCCRFCFALRLRQFNAAAQFLWVALVRRALSPWGRQSVDGLGRQLESNQRLEVW